MLVLDLRAKPAAEGQRLHQSFPPAARVVVAPKLEPLPPQPALLVVRFHARRARLRHRVCA